VFRIADPVDSCVSLPEVGHSTKWTHLGHIIVLGSAANNSVTHTLGHITKIEGRARRFDVTIVGGSAAGEQPKSRKRMCDYLLAMDVCYHWPMTFYAKSDGITGRLDQEERHVV
jgi:hypothetical protein